MRTPFTTRHQDAKPSSRPGERYTPATSPHAIVANASSASLDHLHPGAKFLAMGRALSISASASASTSKPYYSPSPTSPVQPPISSRPNPFNAPSPSLPSTTLPLTQLPSSRFSWGKSSEGVSIRRDDHQSAVPHMPPSGESRSHPASPYYLTQNDKITKEKDEMSSELAPLIIPRISRMRTRRMDPRNVDRRQPLCFINNRLLRWTFYTVLCWLLLGILQSFLVLRRPPWPEGYRPVFTAPDVLPVYQHFQGMHSRQPPLPQDSKFIQLPPSMLGGARELMRYACLPAKGVGAMWTRDKGLEMGPIEYGRYEERLERGGAEYEGVNLHHLCSNASDAIGRVNGAFRDVLFETLIIGPSTAVKEIEPKTLSRFHAHLMGMEELEGLLGSATQQLDQVIYIARHVTKNVRESSMADETSFWKTAVIRDFKAYREIQLLWETKDNMEDLLNIKHNLTVVGSVLEARFDEQIAML